MTFKTSVPGPKQPPRIHGEGCICGDYTLSHCPVKDRKPPACEQPSSKEQRFDFRVEVAWLKWDLPEGIGERPATSAEMYMWAEIERLDKALASSRDETARACQDYRELLDKHTKALRAVHEPPAAHDRDTDWILAIGHALGLESGFKVPIVPRVEPFQELFAVIRERAAQPPSADQPGIPAHLEMLAKGLAPELAAYPYAWCRPVGDGTLKFTTLKTTAAGSADWTPLYRTSQPPEAVPPWAGIDQYTVHKELSDSARRRTSMENILDVLHALNRAWSTKEAPLDIPDFLRNQENLRAERGAGETSNALPYCKCSFTDPDGTAAPGEPCPIHPEK